MLPKFADDLLNSNQTSLAVRTLPTLPESSTVSRNHAISDKRRAEQAGAEWQPLAKKNDPLNDNPASERAASEQAASAEVLALREAEVARVAALQFDGKGKALPTNAGYSRTEEVVEETNGYRITRYSDGSIRKDLIKK